MNKIKLVIASKNEHKVREIKNILADLPLEWDIKAISEIKSVPEVIEDGRTFTANAVKKAVEICKAVDCLVMADDSGLMVDYLGGEPGVLSARYAGASGDDHLNNEKLLYKMVDVPWEKRDAHFHCVIALAEPHGEVHICKGACVGKIGYRLQGEHGFGYDPLFVLPEHDNRTFAEIDPVLKNQISHRAKALAQLKKLLIERFCLD